MRKLGSWLRDHPQILERLFSLTHKFLVIASPGFEKIGYARIEAAIRWPEEQSKKLIFGCKMCGQCILHSTGMTCPMTCPKNLRNGPCGGVRTNGNCEVKPEMRCIWVEAFERSQKMKIYGIEMNMLQPPVNRTLGHRSAWVTMLTQEDQCICPGWDQAGD